MPSRRRLIVAGLLTMLAGIVIMFPARVAYNWFAPPGVSIGGISGTVWRGAASHAASNGVYLRDLRWRAHPLQLFTGKIAYEISASPASGFVEADVAASFGGALHVSELSGALPLQLLQSATGVRGLGGNASVRFERLQLVDGLPVVADGSIEIAQLILPAVAPNSIGGYRADFFTQQDGVVAAIEDTDGVVDLAGSFRILADRSYQFIGQLAAKPETPAEIRQQMQFLGSANDRGQYELRLEGAL